MGFFDNLFGNKQQSVLTEAIGSFKNKGESAMSKTQIKSTKGEGYSFEDFSAMGYGKDSMSSFNNFYKSVTCSLQI